MARTRHGRQARSVMVSLKIDTLIIHVVHTDCIIIIIMSSFFFSLQPAVHCMTIESDEDEFVFMYEIWIGLWYVQSDLLKIKDYHSPN